MKVNELRMRLADFDPDAEVKVLVHVGEPPADWDDASESDLLVEDGEILEVGDHRAVMQRIDLGGDSVVIIADKVFDVEEWQ